MDFLIVGLGNPGQKYEKTRHNAGFMALDYYANSKNKKLDKLKFKGFCEQISLFNKKVLLLKPQTFMNLSGESVIEACNFYKIKPSNVIVLVDDISLDIGKMRIRKKGSHGGQNGLKNISLHLKTDEFIRIKIGVGQKPTPEYDLANWVLSNFSKEDLTKIDEVIKNANDAIDYILNDQIELAMSKFN